MIILLNLLVGFFITFIIISLLLQLTKERHIARTDKILARYFKTTDIFNDKHSRIRRPLVVDLGQRVMILYDLKVWQVKPIIALLVQNGYQLDKIVMNDALAEAISYLFAESLASDRVPLVFHIANHMTAEQLNRLIKAVVAKTNLLSTVRMIQEVIKRNV